MTRIFILLATACSLLMMATLATSLIPATTAANSSAPDQSWRAYISVSAAIAVVSLHLFVSRFMRVTTDRCSTIVAQANLPDRHLAQATKNRLRPFPFITAGVSLVLVACVAGPAGPASASNPSYVSIVLCSLAFAFNLGTFLVEYLSIAAQLRLLKELVPGK